MKNENDNVVSTCARAPKVMSLWVSFFMWLLLIQGFPTNSSRASTGLPFDCQICHLETPQHCLWDCPNIEIVWKLVNKVSREFLGV